MKSYLIASALAGLVCFPLLAQEPPETPKPTKEHEWLKQFVGEWESTAEAVAAPGQPAFTCKGKMTGKMLGGFWVVNETESDSMGFTMKGLQTIGYDPAKKKYVGTWIDSMLNHQWTYQGSLDETGKILTLEAEGPNIFGGGKIAKFRDAYEIKSADHIVATSSMLGEDGKWKVFMTGQVTRKK